jgi:hypothetical protein
MPKASEVEGSHAGTPDRVYRPRSNLHDAFLWGHFLRSLLGWRLLTVAAVWALVIVEQGTVSFTLVLVLAPLSAWMLAFELAYVRFPAPTVLNAELTDVTEYWLDLGYSEVLIEDSLVALGENLEARKASLCRMVLTNQRIAFLPVDLPCWYRVAYVLLRARGPVLTSPLSKNRVIGLDQVEELTTWRPAFSASPAARVNGTYLTFRLIDEQAPWQTASPPEKVRAHFDEVEAAWKAAKGLVAD